MQNTAHVETLPTREKFAGRIYEGPLAHPPLQVLLIEDTHSDILLTRIALDGSRIPYRLQVLKNGALVLPYLKQQDSETLPDVIILDLGLPQLDGFEVLNELASAPNLRAIPVIVVTGYEDFEYIRKSSGFYIAEYVTKPFSAEKLHAVLSQFTPREVH